MIEAFDELLRSVESLQDKYTGERMIETTLERLLCRMASQGSNVSLSFDEESLAWSCVWITTDGRWEATSDEPIKAILATLRKAG